MVFLSHDDGPDPLCVDLAIMEEADSTAMAIVRLAFSTLQIADPEPTGFGWIEFKPDCKRRELKVFPHLMNLVEGRNTLSVVLAYLTLLE